MAGALALSCRALEEVAQLGLDGLELPPQAPAVLGFHAIRTSYDRRSGVLVYFWACEPCGPPLGDARRERYRPSYDPHGNERFLTSQAA